MFSKWKIRGIDNYVFGEDKELYKLPFKSNGKKYGVRKIKMQYPNRWIINNKPLSKRQLEGRLYIDTKPIKLLDIGDTPFI